MKRKICVTAACLVLVGCGIAAANDQQKDPIIELEGAHVAYIDGDFEQMSKSLKSVFYANPSPEVRDNAVALLNRAYDNDCDFQLPVDWSLPEGVLRMSLEQRRAMEPDGLRYKTKVSGHLASEDAISQMRLLAYPDQVIADKNANIGEWYLETNQNNPDDIYFELAVNVGRTSLSPGLYIIETKTKAGDVTSGWVILSDQFSTDTPTVHRPSVGERFTTSTPLMQWDDFRSPEYRSCERRQLKIHVSKIPSDFWDFRWGLSERDPLRTSATIGVGGEGGPLTPGEYWLSLSYREWRPFGPLRLSRRSSTGRNFYVE